MKNRLLFTVLMLFLCADACNANPVGLGFPQGGKYSIATNVGLMINAATDFIVLFLGFLITKNIKTVLTWKFLPYFLIVFWGGFIIDVVAIVPVKLYFMFLPTSNVSILILFVVAGLLLYVFNSWLSDLFFDLENYQKVVIGLAMALLTNPSIGWFFTNQS
jgi:hypothetical protein